MTSDLEIGLANVFVLETESLNIGSFSLDENEYFFSVSSLEKGFMSLEEYYGYFTEIYKRPPKFESAVDDKTPINKQVFLALYREHRERKHYLNQKNEYEEKTQIQRELIYRHQKNYRGYVRYITSPSVGVPPDFFKKRG